MSLINKIFDILVYIGAFLMVVGWIPVWFIFGQWHGQLIAQIGLVMVMVGFAPLIYRNFIRDCADESN